VFDKVTGRPLFSQLFTTWYSGKDNTGFIFDPRLEYDQSTGRFYMVTVGRDAVNNLSEMEISISQTSDPLGTWFKYVFDVKETNPESWLDFPTLGYDSDALFVSGNVFGFNPGTFQHVTLRIFDKATLLSGLPVTPNALV